MDRVWIVLQAITVMLRLSCDIQLSFIDVARGRKERIQLLQGGIR